MRLVRLLEITLAPGHHAEKARRFTSLGNWRHNNNINPGQSHCQFATQPIQTMFYSSLVANLTDWWLCVFRVYSPGWNMDYCGFDDLAAEVVTLVLD